MRTLVPPPPVSRCERCGGELLFERLDQVDPALELDSESLVCRECGHRQSYIVHHEHNVPNVKED